MRARYSTGIRAKGGKMSNMAAFVLGVLSAYAMSALVLGAMLMPDALGTEKKTHAPFV